MDYLSQKEIPFVKILWMQHDYLIESNKGTYFDFFPVIDAVNLD